MLKFDFLDKGLGIVPPSHFVYDYLTKMFPSYILLTDQISLPGCLYFLKYWGICVLQLLVIQGMTSEILKLTFASLSSHAHCTKKSGQKFKYLKNNKSYHF